MGYATITGVVGEGRYQIQIDAGEARRVALRNALTLRIAQLEGRVLVAQGKVAAADAAEDAFTADIAAAVDAYVAADATHRLTGGAPPATTGLENARKALGVLQVKHAPLRVALAALRMDLANARRQFARLDSVDAVLDRGAWCTDYTVDAAVGQVVATMDIPGDTNLVILAPGCRAPTSADGFLLARGLLAPHQAYFDGAIFPGWQKWKPTYRWGTATGIDYGAATMDVDLAPALSSAQRLNVNQTPALQAVPVFYMGVQSADAFVIGDRVVVEFVGQDWLNPRVIGFVDNPRGLKWTVSAGTSASGIDTFFIESARPLLHSTLEASLKSGYVFGYGPPLFIGPDAQVQIRPSGDAWRTLYARLVYTASGDVAGSGAFTPTNVRASFTPMSGYTQFDGGGNPVIAEWEPYGIESHINPGGLFPHPDPYPFDVQVDVTGTSVSIALRPLTGPVPDIVEVRIVEGMVTQFYGAFRGFDGVDMRAKIHEGGIVLSPGYPPTPTHKPLTTLDYELTP